MTAVTGWYFLIDQSISDIVRGDTAVEEAAGNQINTGDQKEESSLQSDGKEAAEAVQATTEEAPVNSADAKAEEDAKLQAAQDKVESEFDTVSKTSKMPSNVAKLGSREKLPSGEVVATLADGTEARNIWAEDEEGKLSYFGYDGCLVKNNYAPDGFFAGEDGTLDESVSRMTGSQGEFLLDTEFVTDTAIDPVILVQKDPDNVYECLFIKRFSFGFDEVFGVIADPDSNHAYVLKPYPDQKADFKSTKGPLLTILDDGKTMIVSDAGVTETYHTR